MFSTALLPWWAWVSIGFFCAGVVWMVAGLVKAAGMKHQPPAPKLRVVNGGRTKKQRKRRKR